MKSKMVSIFLCILMIASVFAAITLNLGPLSMNASGAGGLADSPWPMFRGNLNHTGLSPYDTSANPGKLKWSFMTGAYVYSPPSIGSDGTIYVGSYDNKLYAINPYGSEKWSYSTGSGVGSSPTIGSDGTIYIGSYDTKLYAIRPNGTEKWNFKTGYDIRSSPAIGSDGTIYMGSQDTKLYAINPDGTEKWNFPTGDSVESSPAIDSDGTIYVGSLDHKLYAINPDGTEKWNFMTGHYVWSSPAIGSDETIYVGSDDNKLYAIEQYGTERWNFTTYGDVVSSPAIGLDGTIYVGSNDGKMYAINPDGTQKWNITTGPWVISSPSIGSDGTIYVGSGDNNLYAINSDGTEKWRYATGDGIISSPAIGSDGTIFIGSRDNKLHAIGNPNLKVEVTSHFSILNSAAQSAITVHITDGTNPVKGANVNLTTDNGGIFSPQNGTTDINGNFTSIFNAPTVTTQIICRITAQANKTGYNNGSGYVDITINPIPWPMFRQNLSHTGVSPYDTSSNPGKLKWVFPTAGSVESSPAIGSDGTIYVGSDDNKLYAIYPDGTEKWSFETGDGIRSSPAIDSDGTIYVGSYDHKLYAINPDGIQKWNFTTGDWIFSSPAVGSDGTIYVGSRDKRLYAINPNGSEKWNFETGHWIWSSPTIGSDGTIYVGSYDDKLYAINPNGTEKWSFKTGFGIWSSPTIGSDGTIYVGSLDFKLYAINPDGTEKWSFTTGDGVFSSPAIGMDGTIYFGSDDHKLYAINPDGSEKWNFTTGSYILSSPTISSDGSIYIGSCDNRFYAINPDSSEKWNLTTVDHVHSSPAIGSDGTIYVGSGDNELYAIGQATLPDLRVTSSDIVFYPDSPVANGTSVKINGTIHNVGTMDANNIKVSFYNGDPTLGGALIGVNQTIPFLMIGENVTVNITWLPPSPGTYEIYVAVDYPLPGNVIESNETNNIASKALDVIDILPPIISNLQPPDASTTNDNTTTISADYSDPSGINVSSVVLEVDGIDVTSSATVMASGVSYTPVIALSDGSHLVYLEVKDNIGNLANITWTFTVDTTPPIITNLQPSDTSTTNDSIPMISADYSDPSGINVSSVMMKVNGIDITAFAMVTANVVNYIPGTVLSDGIHTVYLEVKDNYGNLATVIWTFTVDTTPPLISNLQPPDASITNNSIPIISSDYSDPSGINVSSALLKVDGIDVTSFATITVSNVSYLPGIALSDDVHTVYLEVRDIYGNIATMMWTFTVDTLPPIISNLQPPNASTTNDSTPAISADYSDPSGIDANSVVLKVDGIDVTLFATVSANDVSYLPGATLSDGTHTVYLEAKDNAGNLATTSWSFIVDTIPPTITNLQPPDASITNNSTSMIGADYSDLSGINVGSVVFKVDGVDVTSTATATVGDVSYLPGVALSDGIYTVSLEVRDNVNNLATATWSFTVDTSPPITTIIPDNHTVKLGTLFTLTVTDGVGGCGVNYTQYRIDEDQWIDYLGPFSIDTYEHHNITYRSADNLGNVENENILSIYVPTDPITTLIIGTPQYGTTPKYVNYSTQFSFSVIDYSGTGYDTYYYIDSLPTISYIGPFTVSTEGTHAIYFYSTDNLGNIEDTKEFDIIVDNSPPTTDIVIGDPHYVSGDTWVTSATEFTLNANDGGLIPVGVNHTMYRIWNGGVWTPWNSYAGGFSLGTNEGVSYLELYSIDRLGNGEPFQNRTFIIDNIPPTTTISVGDPKYKGDPNDIWNITSATTFTLSGVDDGVGLNNTEYRIWNNGSWSDWYKYTDGFNLGSDNGTRHVEWFSVDYLGNKGGTRNESYFIDNIPPVTNYLLLLESDNTEARLSLIPGDVGSGVDLTKYRIDSGDWINYSSTFVINESGEHVIYFWSTDKLGNIEDTKEVTVLVEKPGTPTPSDEEKKEANNKPLIALIFSIILLLVGSYVSYKRPLNFKGEVTRDRLLTWLIVVLPFIIAEIITGVVSLVTGKLSVPPLLGVGMIVDTAILVGGIVADGYIYRKGQKIEESEASS